ncbi:hypothetical protein GPY51_19455 [Photorhabdus laumondii subsp. laumondii]|uniref:Uncharacterized protein n=2 Tax=Photorhabdus TaxID=29487 RepID=A0AAW6BI94_9GAMM|nr:MULTISPECIES: hypothetical protein [Photorhabdus]AXG42656.1 hypothetical protein PluDJC_10640 [Photorhabdus laumondii subsp. laumondii]MCC8384752.1 hypothetical protein [Photorhabdus laumondii]MCC8413489.1 hypothetical protein [Photorhabdus laumondii]MDB6372291.1 hypothetical protein [Photorhabdus bodei]NDK96465.1 hypothetical protein [Photorhabdus laumondii subsp. laumondii]
MNLVLSAKQIKDLAEFVGFSVSVTGRIGKDCYEEYVICEGTIADDPIGCSHEYNGLIVQATTYSGKYPLTNQSVHCHNCFVELYPLAQFDMCDRCREESE